MKPGYPLEGQFPTMTEWAKFRKGSGDPLRPPSHPRSERMTRGQRCQLQFGIRPACIVGRHGACPHGTVMEGLDPEYQPRIGVTFSCMCLCHFRADGRRHLGPPRSRRARERACVRAYLYHARRNSSRTRSREKTVIVDFDFHPYYIQGFQLEVAIDFFQHYEPDFGQGQVRAYLEARRSGDIGPARIG